MRYFILSTTEPEDMERRDIGYVQHRDIGDQLSGRDIGDIQRRDIGDQLSGRDMVLRAVILGRQPR